MTRRRNPGTLTRVLDWRFLAAVGVCLLVVWTVYSSARAFQAKDRQIDRLIQSGHEQAQDARQGRATATRERDRLLAQQARLVRLYRDLLARQDALLAYLQREGIPVPQNLEPVSPSAHKSSPRAPTAGQVLPVHKEQKQPRPGTGAPAPPPPHKPGPPGEPPPRPGGPAPTHPPTPVRDLLGTLEGLLP